MLIEIITGSLRMLKKEPKLFVPRIVTTSLYTVVMIYLAFLASRVVRAVNDPLTGIEDRTILSTLFLDLIVLAACLIFIMIIDLVTYAMYPALVRDHHEGRRISLTSSLREAVGAWRVLAVLGLVILLIAIAVGLIVVLVEMFLPFLLQKYGILAYLVLASFASLLAIVPMVLLFFVVPAGVIDKKGVFGSFMQSFRLAQKHGREVFLINFTLLILSIAAYALMTYADSKIQGVVALYSMIVFIFVRMLQAVVYTYISVINPYVYMKVR